MNHYSQRKYNVTNSSVTDKPLKMCSGSLGVLSLYNIMAIKLTKRKGFNFFRSYYDVYNELETDADKVAFIDALLDRQFLGIKPTNLKGMAKFAYISQTNSIDSQVKGYEDKTKTILDTTQGGCVGVVLPPTEQVEEKGEEEVKDKVKNIYRSFVHLSISIDEVEKLKIDYDIKTIDSVLDSIENYKNNKNYKSLYLTAKKWLEKEPKKQSTILQRRVIS